MIKVKDKESLMRAAIVTVVALAAAGIVAGVSAQQAGFTRTVLQRGDLSVPGREGVTAIAEFQPSATVGRHTHPGEEIGYVLEGTILLEQDGRPAVTLGVGKTFFIPAGTIHNATNSGSGRARVLANYIVDKGKPLATPAAAK
jgi:quercetin dioxygenase-like cupin family protein